MTEERIGPIRSVVIDVNDLERAAAFWSAVLGARRGRRLGAYLRLESSDPGPEVLLQVVPEPNQVKARLHLDIATPNMDADAQRVEALGGRKLRVVQEDSERFIVMTDTEGNEFCLVPPASA